MTDELQHISAADLAKKWSHGVRFSEEFIPAAVQCIVCNEWFDEREVFMVMGVVYCTVHIVFVVRARIRESDPLKEYN